MRRLLLAALLPLAACAHSQERSSDTSEGAPVAEAPSAAPAPATPSDAAPEASPPSALTPDQQRARAELTQAQQRLEGARRELNVAESERTAAAAEQQHAQAETGSASQAIDSIAQAKAAEAARAAARQQRLADIHHQYAAQLTAARQAEIEAAQARVRTADTEAWIAAHPGSTPDERDLFQRRLSEVRSGAAQARSRAEQLGEVALQAQRRWDDASRPTAPERPQPGSTGAGPGAPGAEPGAAPPNPAHPPPAPPPRLNGP